MSSDIWTRCAGESELTSLQLEPWRVVEAQHQVSTRKLVDSDAEQQVLEELIDSVKPPHPNQRLHYLLSTPLRYPPLRYGSRFGTVLDPGIWYGAESIRTALAESAYYRLVFLEGTRAELGALRTEHTAFRARVRTEHGIDLTVAPWTAWSDVISSPVEYDPTQRLGGAMRRAGVEAFRYVSARDPDRGINVGVFSARVFGRAKPRGFETWHCISTRAGVEFRKRDYFERTVLGFDRETFLVDGLLPAPAL